MNTNDRIRLEKKGRIGIITLDSPGTLNILDTQMLSELQASLSSLKADREVRVVIITGNRNFCAGADIRELKRKSPEEAEAFARLGQGICSTIEEMGKIVIAAVNGYALGGGCEIALCCDLRVAAESARFGQPELKIGLIPGFGATQRLPRIIGIGRAKEMILTGEMIDAGEAVSFGLANRLVKDEDLLEKTLEIAEIIAQNSAPTVEQVKILINGMLGTREGLEKEIRAFAECFTTQDHAEGMRAFLEKRKPMFRGI